MKVEVQEGKRREKEPRKKTWRKESGCLLLEFLSSGRQVAFMSLIAFSVLKHINGSFTWVPQRRLAPPDAPAATETWACARLHNCKVTKEPHMQITFKHYYYRKGEVNRESIDGSRQIYIRFTTYDLPANHCSFFFLSPPPNHCSE